MLIGAIVVVGICYLVGLSMRVEKFIACALVPLALLAAAPTLEPGDAPIPAIDHVPMLAGTWSCRSAAGVLRRSTGVRDGDVLKVHDDIDDHGKRSTFDDRYTFDPAQRRWHVVSGLAGFTSDAAPWSDGRWTIEGNDVNAVPLRTTFDLLPNGDVRRTSFYRRPGGAFVMDGVERCTPGPTPPPADACIAENYPAATLEAAPVDGRSLPRNLAPGVVLIVVSLNERSELVNARILSSPNAAFNGPALAAARASKFRTAIVNCKPVAADYIFSVGFTRG